MEKSITARSQPSATRTRIVVLKPVKPKPSEDEPIKEEKTAKDVKSQKKKKKRKPKPKPDKEMQILDGKHKGKYLKTTESPSVRPTARRVREKVFLLLGKRTRKSRFLDLCAGSGGVGIEAISRGALLGTFVERSAKMCSFIKKNLETCEISSGHGEVFQTEALPFLKKMEKRKRTWDVVFLDPPYDANYDEILDFFSRGTCLRKEGGMVVIEHPKEMFFPEQLGVLKRRRVILEGETALSFFEYRTKEYVPRPKPADSVRPQREGFQKREGVYQKRREEGDNRERRDNGFTNEKRDFPPRRDGTRPTFTERKPFNPNERRENTGGFRPRTNFGERSEGSNDFRPRNTTVRREGSSDLRPRNTNNTTVRRDSNTTPRPPFKPNPPRS